MTKKLYAVFEFVLFIALLTVSIILAIDKHYAVSVKNGIELWIACVLPALFPYFFITSILSALKITGKLSTFLSPLTNTLFNVSGCVGYAFFMSVICGYPVGAKTVSDLKGKGAISDAESVRASALCSTSSPTFLLGSVGNLMFRNGTFGLLLFLAHFISAIIVGVIFSFYKRKERPKNSATLHNQQSAQRVDNLLYQSAYSSVISVLVVGSLITVFYLLTELLLNLKLLSPIIKLFAIIVKDKEIAESIILGAFECTKGLSSLSKAKFSVLTLPISGAICSFGGLSVIAQSLAYLKKAKIKTASFILSKILSAVICFVVCLIFSAICF